MLTILVQSCDKYSDVWPIFFDCFFKQWSDCPYRVVLNTETKTYCHSGFNIECFQIYKGYTDSDLKNVSWSERFMETLEKIDTDYTLVFLEDFFIREPVNQIKFEEFLSKVQRINGFGAVYFNYNNKPVFYDNTYDLYYIHNDANRRINSVCGLWKTNVLMETLVSGENPWEYERNASYRFRNKKEKFYSVAYESSPIKLNFREQITQGKWTYDCIDLFKNLNINVDMEKRGFIEYPYVRDITLRGKIFDILYGNIYVYSLLSPIRRIFRMIRGRW